MLMQIRKFEMCLLCVWMLSVDRKLKHTLTKSPNQACNCGSNVGFVILCSTCFWMFPRPKHLSGLQMLKPVLIHSALLESRIIKWAASLLRFLLLIFNSEFSLSIHLNSTPNISWLGKWLKSKTIYFFAVFCRSTYQKMRSLLENFWSLGLGCSTICCRFRLSVKK